LKILAGCSGLYFLAQTRYTPLMARPLRIQYEDAVYHITSRGNARQDILLDDEDRLKFLEVLAEAVERYHWICHAYRLMPNHYHLLVETPLANLSQGMRQLNGVYTQAFNRRHKRTDHLLQGRYKAILVEKEAIFWSWPVTSCSTPYGRSWCGIPGPGGGAVTGPPPARRNPLLF